MTIPVERGINDAVDEEFGIIHIDAHMDLCEALEGDLLSHGSTERRALELSHVKSLEICTLLESVLSSRMSLSFTRKVIYR